MFKGDKVVFIGLIVMIISLIVVLIGMIIRVDNERKFTMNIIKEERNEEETDCRRRVTDCRAGEGLFGTQ